MDYSANEGFTLQYKWDDKDELYKSSPGAYAPMVVGSGKGKYEATFGAVIDGKVIQEGTYYPDKGETFPRLYNGAGTATLYDAYYKKYIDLTLGKNLITRHLNLNIVDFLNFDDRNILRINNQNFVVKNTKVTVSKKNGLEPVKIEAYKLI
jgi:hypothetical protein